MRKNFGQVEISFMASNSSVKPLNTVKLAKLAGRYVYIVLLNTLLHINLFFILMTNYEFFATLIINAKSISPTPKNISMVITAPWLKRISQRMYILVNTNSFINCYTSMFCMTLKKLTFFVMSKMCSVFAGSLSLSMLELLLQTCIILQRPQTLSRLTLINTMNTKGTIRVNNILC